MPVRTALKLLLIEDSEFDALMVANVLRQSGYEPEYRRVETALGLRTALAEGAWNLVICDYHLPEFSMTEAMEILQQSALDLPFIIVSGGIGEDIAVAAMKAGAHDYLMKGNLARLGPAVTRELREAAERAEHRRVETALRDSELRHRLLWETSTDAVLLCDVQGQIHFANPAVETIFGYKPEEVIGQPLTLLHPPTPPPATGLAAPTDVKPSRRSLRETNGRRKDGATIAIEIACSEMEFQEKRWLVEFIRDVTERKRTELELLENKQQFQVAREIQGRLFPKNAPELPGFELAGASYPAEATGGDYYDFLPMFGTGLGLVVGDVTGHGIGPALLMAETRAYLRLLARNRDDVGDILNRANRILAEDVGAERYVTLLLAKLDPHARTLTYASAGHPAGYLLDAAGQIKARLKRTGIPLGINPEAHYVAGTPLTLNPGDLALFLTDGVEEAMSPENDFFGEARVIEVARANREKPAREIVEALYQAARQFAKNEPQLDDFTAVILKVLA